MGTIYFRDLPNAGKLLLALSDDQLMPDGDIVKVMNAKKNMAAVVFREDTLESFMTYSGSIVPTSGYYRYTYTVADNGGALGSHELSGPRLDTTCDVIDGYYDVTDPAVGVGSSFSIGSSSLLVDNLKGSAVIATNGTAGRKQLIPNYYSAGVTNIVDISANGQPVINITGAALTALSFELFLFVIRRTT